VGRVVRNQESLKCGKGDLIGRHPGNGVGLRERKQHKGGNERDAPEKMLLTALDLKRGGGGTGHRTKAHRQGPVQGSRDSYAERSKGPSPKLSSVGRRRRIADSTGEKKPWGKEAESIYSTQVLNAQGLGSFIRKGGWGYQTLFAGRAPLGGI